MDIRLVVSKVKVYKILFNEILYSACIVEAIIIGIINYINIHVNLIQYYTITI
jgi:hypothetical protein